jgi:RNA polymerase sigma factor (sigma-70 family)
MQVTAAMPHRTKEMAANRTAELEQVYLTYLRDARFWAAQFRISKEDYEDCVQDAWIKAAAHVNQYDEAVGELRPWFHGILFHQIVDSRRKHQSRERTTQRLNTIGQASHANSMAEEGAPWSASGEYHLLREECQEAVQKLLQGTDELLRKYAPAHKVAFNSLINDVALNEIALKAGRSEESIGASVRRKRQEFVVALRLDTPLGERLRSIKALAEEIGELRRLLDDSMPAAQRPTFPENITGDEE